MMGCSRHELSEFQREVLRAFWEREQGYFLSGGAALVGYHLHHRTTTDLDLFTLEEAALRRGRAVLAEVAAALGAVLETLQDSPGFQRHLLRRGQETLVVDLVLERVPQLTQPKPVLGGVRVDPPQEILANKLTALLSRAEERDLVDVLFLERAGLRVEDALPAAFAKDGGCTPGQLAFVLSEVVIPDGVVLPADVAPEELRVFLGDLIRRLRRAALPPRG